MINILFFRNQAHSKYVTKIYKAGDNKASIMNKKEQVEPTDVYKSGGKYGVISPKEMR